MSKFWTHPKASSETLRSASRYELQRLSTTMTLSCKFKRVASLTCDLPTITLTWCDCLRTPSHLWPRGYMLLHLLLRALRLTLAYCPTCPVSIKAEWKPMQATEESGTQKHTGSRTPPVRRGSMNHKRLFSHTVEPEGMSRRSSRPLSMPEPSPSSLFDPQVHIGLLPVLNFDQEVIIRINVGGKEFSTTRMTLESRGSNYFTNLISGKMNTTRTKEGAYFIDRDPYCFSVCGSEYQGG